MLTYPALLTLTKIGVIDAPMEQIKASSIDVRMSDRVIVESRQPGYRTAVDLAKGQSFVGEERDISGEPFILRRGKFALASTVERIKMPSDMTGLFCLRSTLARAGVQHATSIGIHPGWEGSLTLELTNTLSHHELIFEAGMRIGHIYFFHHKDVPEEMLYSGRYQGLNGVSGAIREA